MKQTVLATKAEIVFSIRGCRQEETSQSMDLNTACLCEACQFLTCDGCCALQALEAQAEIPANIVTQSKAPESSGYE